MKINEIKERMQALENQYRVIYFADRTTYDDYRLMEKIDKEYSELEKELETLTNKGV